MIGLYNIRKTKIIMLNLLKQNKGFTLVELLVAMVLSIFLLGGTILLYTSSRSTVLETERLSADMQALRFIGNFLIQDVRMAGSSARTGATLIADFAEVLDNGDTLAIRYAADQDCTMLPTGATDPEFDANITIPETGVAYNTFTLDGANQTLICIGKRASFGVPGYENDVEPLVRGVQRMEFSLVERPGVGPIGVQICFDLGSPRASGGIACPDYDYGITVAFRNPVLQAAAR